MNGVQGYRKALLIFVLVLAAVGCGVGVFLGAGAGLALWLASRSDVGPVAAAPKPTRIWPTVTATSMPATPEPAEVLELSSPTATQSPTSSPTPTSTPTIEPTPTASPTVTVSATADVELPAVPPTSTATVTSTPAPAYAFVLVESDAFPTGKDDLDVFVAVTDADNNPLDGYRILGAHSNGQQMESQTSVARWSENSGAMHYKAGNIKLHIEHSPAGSWALTLVDQTNQVVAAPVDLASDPAAPQWHFLLFRLVDVDG